MESRTIITNSFASALLGVDYLASIVAIRRSSSSMRIAISLPQE